uniref:Uncharacterized protein n=1 Tax=Physcomitrium patens TaxID=3218 RepID=A0A2K1JVR9_PHYPA|nr:hypothetical protein PHYPA_015393 [Physcomitrium patens]
MTTSSKEVLKSKFKNLDIEPTIYLYNELKIATQDFHPDNNYRVVYKFKWLRLVNAKRRWMLDLMFYLSKM